ncbi:MarR family winged helix-turn-helix transcriptional regulator [Enterococcus gallinarum]|uniref:MarR family winged helix-turn-helix transcriptional regulator n=1 Tax=Enterococcus gallinarum TaxID=1353 RepID=UPI0012E21137|nr:MarR family transcriptional regulator [Enterococcus gallinarum]MUO32319.1 MarR family transcriptional regulator [Enterococcus gallinarum]
MQLREISRLLYQLKIANQELTATFEKSTGFSLTRYELMMFIKENGRCSQSDLQTELKIDSAAVTRHLKILEQKNYVVRERNRDNNREVFVEITPKAKKELSACENHQEKEAFALSLTEEEAAAFLQLLNKLMK